MRRYQHHVRMIISMKRSMIIGYRLLTQVTESKAKLSELKQTLVTVKSKTSVDIKYSRKEHRAKISTLLRVYEQYERQLEGQVRFTSLVSTHTRLARQNSPESYSAASNNP